MIKKLQNPSQNPLFSMKLINIPILLADSRKYLFALVIGLTIGIILCFSFGNYVLDTQVNKQNTLLSSTDQVQTPTTKQNSTPVIVPTTPPQNSSINDENKTPETKLEGCVGPAKNSTPVIVPTPENQSIHNDTKKPVENKVAKAMHAMTDKELLWKASFAPKIQKYPFDMVPKVAFMFLVKGPVTFAPLWEKFFKGHEGLFSIYVHSNPGFNDSVPENSIFYGRNIPSKKVEWGNVNMMEAERRLLANALLDLSNQRFVLLSESCIPLFNFSTIYTYLINSTQTFVESYDLDNSVGRGRYRSHMLPEISLKQWRKGAQWVEMDRDLALEVVSDQVYFPVFQNHCKDSCYSDEHYLPTFVNIKYGQKNSNRTLTWVNWSRGGPHPYTYRRPFVTIDFLEKLRSGTKCEYNGKSTNICHLFARKFSIDTLYRLLKFAPKVMHFNP